MEGFIWSKRAKGTLMDWAADKFVEDSVVFQEARARFGVLLNAVHQSPATKSTRLDLYVELLSDVLPAVPQNPPTPDFSSYLTKPEIPDTVMESAKAALLTRVNAMQETYIASTAVLIDSSDPYKLFPIIRLTERLIEANKLLLSFNNR